MKNKEAESGQASGEKNQVLERLLERLSKDEIEVLEEFDKIQSTYKEFYGKIEIAHEFLDLLTFKIKESKSTMDKKVLAQFSLDFFLRTIREYGYNPKFVAVQCKALITYHQNQKDLDKAIEVCEFLIRHGITDDDAKGFHVRLDELYRLRKKVDERNIELSDIKLPVADDDDEDKD